MLHEIFQSILHGALSHRSVGVEPTAALKYLEVIIRRRSHSRTDHLILPDRLYPVNLCQQPMMRLDPRDPVRVTYVSII